MALRNFEPVHHWTGHVSWGSGVGVMDSLVRLQIAQFSFLLPPIEEMESLNTLMTAVMVFIDLLGNYKMKPEQKVGLRLL